MSILVQRYLRRSSLLESLAEEWQIAGRNSIEPSDVQEMLDECVELGTLTSHTWKTLSGLLMKGKIDDTETVGRLVRSALAKAKHAIGLINKGVVAAQRNGCQVSRAQELRRVADELETVEKHFDDMWPTANQKMAEESLAAYRRGEFQDSGDLLTDAQDPHSSDS